MIHNYENNKDPLKEVNILFALRWSIRAWTTLVSSTSIYNCFRKSTLVSSPINLPTPIVPPDMGDLYRQVQRVGHIQDIMAISNFLNPEEEDVAEDTVKDPEAVLQQVLDDHLGLDGAQDDEDSESESLRPVHTVAAAKTALQLLIEFTEQQEGLETHLLRSLERLERDIQVIEASRQTQSEITHFFR